MKIAAELSVGLLLVAFVVPGSAADKSSPLEFKMKSIDGADVDLSKYTGDVVLIVNVASKCGLTPQYAQLEEVYTKYKDKGLQVLGFPANEFGRQEPGTNAQIRPAIAAATGIAERILRDSKTGVALRIRYLHRQDGLLRVGLELPLAVRRAEVHRVPVGRQGVLLASAHSQAARRTL